MLKAVIFLAERDEPEMSVRRRHVNFLADFNDRIVFHAISYEVADAHKLGTPFVGSAAEPPAGVP